MLGVAVLRRPGGVRGDRYFTDPEAVAGAAAVLEDPDRRRSVDDEFAVAGTGDRHCGHEASLTGGCQRQDHMAKFDSMQVWSQKESSLSSRPPRRILSVGTKG